MWQDGSVTEIQPEEAEPLAVRTISDVDGLRALADPTRLALLNALMDQRRGELPIMSVKELAARLGEPQTKLYRHVKQLEAAGLIKVAATRMVSGILEQRYQARQRDFTFGNRFLREHADESEAVLRAMISNARDGLLAALADKRLAPDADPPAAEHLRPTLFSFDARVSPERAAEIRSLLKDVMTAIGEEPADEPNTVPVSTLILYNSPPEPDEE
jgi:DNA-binding transcriptional ArsR family regulator